MSFIFISLAIWLAAWLSIIILHAIALRATMKDPVRAEAYEAETDLAEIVKDGNNLFSTGFIYMLITLACHFIHLSVVRWILFAAMVIFTVLPVMSCFPKLRWLKPQNPPWVIISIITCIICNTIPLVMAIMVLTGYLL